MTAAIKQDSNSTGLRFTKEASPGVLPASPVWTAMEPNTYKDFGGQYKTVARNPINSSRQRKKGVLTDLDASGGWQSDLTFSNTQSFIEGVMFANFRTKSELSVATVDSTAGYEPATGGASYTANDLVFGKGFKLDANNGLKVVTGTPLASSVEFAGMASESGSLGTISRVGFQFASGDLSIDASGPRPKLISTTKDFTTLGLIIGEWVFIGDDALGNSFANVANTGYARIYSIAAHEIDFDKTDAPFVTDAGTGKTVRVYFGRVVKNELQDSIVASTYQFERQLGVSDTATPMQQAEYLTGSAFDQFMLTVNTADKVTWDVMVMSNSYEVNTSAEGPKAGARPAIVEADAFNTSSDVRRFRMARAVDYATPLFGYLSTGSFTVKNNIKQNKAIGVLGAFAQTAGMFEVTATVDAYFTNVSAAAAVKDNDDVTLDLIMAVNNAGIILDLPLVSLGDGRNKVAANQPITLALTVDAASAAKINPNTDYTLMLMYFDYLPSVAM